jgi:Cu/Zn superoxide dismutase
MLAALPREWRMELMRSMRDCRVRVGAAAAAVALVLALGGLLAPAAGAEDAKAKAGGPLVAVLHPVNQATGAVDESTTLGTVKFTQGKGKVDVLVQVDGVSIAGGEGESAADGEGTYYPHGIHIHDGGSCASTTDKDGKVSPAAGAGPHYDPKKTGSHKGPAGDGHAGDLPNLRVLEDGSGILMTSTNRLTMDQLRGRTVILHANSDNYTDTPANGGSGARIACGVIAPE